MALAVAVIPCITHGWHLVKEVAVAAPKCDTWLVVALDWLENPDISIPISLFLNGMVVSGKPISQIAYFRGLEDQFRVGAEKTSDEKISLSEYFAVLAVDSEKTVAAAQERELEQLATMPPWVDRTPEQDAVLERLVRNYIYLRDVTAIMGGGVTLSVTYWRGRLSEVAGWCFGRAEIGPSRYSNPIPA
jgi:hypothetical protein